MAGCIDCACVRGTTLTKFLPLTNLGLPTPGKVLTLNRKKGEPAENMWHPTYRHVAEVARAAMNYDKLKDMGRDIENFAKAVGNGIEQKEMSPLDVLKYRFDANKETVLEIIYVSEGSVVFYARADRVSNGHRESSLVSELEFVRHYLFIAPFVKIDPTLINFSVLGEGSGFQKHFAKHANKIKINGFSSDVSSESYSKSAGEVAVADGNLAIFSDQRVVFPENRAWTDYRVTFFELSRMWKYSGREQFTVGRTLVVSSNGNFVSHYPVYMGSGGRRFLDEEYNYLFRGVILGHSVGSASRRGQQREDSDW